MTWPSIGEGQGFGEQCASTVTTEPWLTLAPRDGFWLTTNPSGSSPTGVPVGCTSKRRPAVCKRRSAAVVVNPTTVGTMTRLGLA